MVDHSDQALERPHLLAALALAQLRLGKSLAARSGERVAIARASHGRLLHLLPPDGARPTALAEGWISKQAVGKRIQELVDAGLVAVTPDPDDRRATVVRRTAEGDRTLALMMRETADFEIELAREVGERRYRTFRAVLDELIAR